MTDERSELIENWRRRKYAERCPKALEIYDRIADGEDNPKWKDIDRVSGLVMCDVCGRQFYDHPEHPNAQWLTIICDGRFVKL